MSNFKYQLASGDAMSTVQHGRTDGRTYEDPTCVTNRLTSGTCAGGAEAFFDEVVRFPVTRTGERAEIPWDLRRAVYRRDGWRCKFCGEGIGAQLELDHIMPWSAGGPDTGKNLRTLCQRCNTDRCNYSVAEDGRRVLPVTWWCIDCHRQPDEGESPVYVPRPLQVRPGPPRFDGWHGGMTFAYCATCDINGYTEVVL